MDHTEHALHEPFRHNSKVDLNSVDGASDVAIWHCNGKWSSDGAYHDHAYKDCHGIWLNKDQSQHSGFIARRPLVDGFFDALGRFYSEIPFVEHISERSPSSYVKDNKKIRMFEMFLKIILDLTSLFEDDKLHIPLRLQYCIINMLQRILNGIPEMVAAKITNQYQIWNVLLSVKFYFTGLPLTDDDEDILDEDQDAKSMQSKLPIPEWMSVERLVQKVVVVANEQSAVGAINYVFTRPHDARILSYRRFCASVFVRHKILVMLEHLVYCAEDIMIDITPQIRSVVLALDRIAVNEHPSDICAIQLNSCFQACLMGAPNVTRKTIVENNMLNQLIRCTRSLLRIEKKVFESPNTKSQDHSKRIRGAETFESF